MFFIRCSKSARAIITATTGPVTTTYEKKKRGRPGARPRGEARIPNILRCVVTVKQLEAMRHILSILNLKHEVTFDTDQAYAIP